MKAILFVIASLTAAFVAQGQTNWIRVAETDDSTWEVKPGSFEVSQTKGKQDIAVVIGRINNSKTKQVTVGKWYVTLYDCSREMGKMVTLDLDGKFRFENDFVFGAGSVATAIAESICAVHAFDVKSRDQKGI